MLHPCPSSSKQILIRNLNDLLQLKSVAQAVVKLWTVKVGVQKNFQTFWVRGYVFRDFIQRIAALQAIRVRSPAEPNFEHPQIRCPWTKVNEFCIIYRSNYYLFGARSLRAQLDFKLYFYFVKVPSNHIINKMMIVRE